MRNVSLCFLLFVSWARAALAQSSEAVGVRAQGMGGAFTAVADDATATWWNPAGLAGGAYANLILEYGTQQEPKDDVNGAGLAVPAARTTTKAFAAAFPALGVSYYRLRVSEIRPLTSTAEAVASRQDPATVAVLEQTLVLNQLGVTIGQSIGDHFVVGSTLKLVQGSHATALQPASVASLDQAQELDGPSETHGGIDLGAMAFVREDAAGADRPECERSGVQERSRHFYAQTAVPGQAGPTAPAIAESLAPARWLSTLI